MAGLTLVCDLCNPNDLWKNLRVMSPLTEWNSFYVIVGSSAGALIGLQFVVLTLIAQRPQQRTAEASSAFATPSVVHFGVALLVAAVCSAPWYSIRGLAVLWSLVGVGGIAYSIVVARRMRRQKLYRPVFEDWLFHFLFPIAAYAVLAIAAFVANSHARASLYLVAAATLVFLFIGIHNAWDGITWHVFHDRGGKGDRKH